ncbi:MAG: GAF domain-containing protein [Bryobacterales bacterium]|nr:GAF domain-containing protein [Bryobacterales bacterium]
MKKSLPVILVCLGAALLPAQKPAVTSAPARVGHPFVTHYIPNTYGGSAQGFSIAQDGRGVLYFGLGSGLVEFDGVSYRAIATPGNTVVRALTTDSTGRVYAGTVNDFGYLAPDASGQMQYVSLVEFIPKEQLGFQDVYSMAWTPQGLFVQAPERLLRLTPESAPTAERMPGKWQVKAWRPQGRMSALFHIFGATYVRQTGAGLQRVNGDALELAPGGETFAKSSVQLAPYSGTSLDDGEILIATPRLGFYLMSRSGVRRFPTDADALVERLGVSRMVTLQDGTFGLALGGGGFLNLDREGKTKIYLDRASGALLADGGLSVFTGRDGLVWLGLQKGIAKIETPSSLSRFGESAGLTGFVNDLVRHKGILYAATMNGIYYLDEREGVFKIVTGLPKGVVSSAFSLTVVGNRLLAPLSFLGLVEITGTTLKEAGPRPLGAGSAFVLYQSIYDRSRLYLGCDNMLVAYRIEPSGKLIFEGKVAETPAIRSIAETSADTIWLGLESQGVARIQLKGRSLTNAAVRQFGPADGLAGEGGVSIHKVAGRILFAVRGGVHEFDQKSGRFVASPQFQVVGFGGNPEEYGIVEDRQGNIIVNLGQETAVLRPKKEGGYAVDTTALRRIANLDVTKTYMDESGVVWFGEADGLVRYDPKMTADAEAEFPALIRRVTAGEKTVVYGGGGFSGAGKAQAPLPWGSNALRFEYAATSFHDLTANQYQTRLEGFDDNWSAWTDETRRDYTNLPPGEFRFHVRARNLFQKPSSEAVYSFTILPPWYRTWLAYLFYAVLLLGLGLGIDRLQRRRVETRERERAHLREAELRAETAAAQAQTLKAENDRKMNVELLSDIGKELTSSLELDTIFYRLYGHVNQLMDASVFGVGLYREAAQEIDIRLAMEKGKRYAPYTRDAKDKNQLPVWCIDNRQPVFINDISTEAGKYISDYHELGKTLEDGTQSQSPNSLIYLPLIVKERVLGIITVQSFDKNAYTAYHLDLLENLAAYTAIALDNADAYRRLKSAQDQLVVQEKLASLGALTAGIAHEIKNPLNFVNNFAELSVELNQELREEIDKHRAVIGEADCGVIEELLGDLEKNARKINEHGRRADSIVRSMLLHSRGQRGERQPTDINAMLEEYVNLSYHGMRAQDSGFNATIERDLAPAMPLVNVVPQDLSRVFLNILNNACYAVNEKSRKVGSNNGYAPTLRVVTADLGELIEVRIRDNGMGIPPEVRAQIFNPFFTTKPTGQGTGLGLSISHEIVVQEHGGQLDVLTEPGQFTEFVVRLPKEKQDVAK